MNNKKNTQYVHNIHTYTNACINTYQHVQKHETYTNNKHTYTNFIV
jgi:hypothetical protein